MFVKNKSTHMKEVSFNSIEKAIEKIDGMDDDALSKLAEYYAQKQEILLSYAGQAAVEYQNSELEGLLIYYFCIILESFSNEGLEPKTITEAMIDEHEDGFFAVLNNFFNSEDTAGMEDFSGQPTLINFMLVEISTPDIDGTELSDDTATQLFVVTSAIIALLSAASE